MTVGYEMNDDAFNDSRINFHKFDGTQSGAPKEHKFRILPAYAPNKLFFKASLHWGFPDENGKNKALLCSKDVHGHCPICDKIAAVQGDIKNIEAALTTEFDPIKRPELESKKAELEEYVKDHKRKPTYLWNIVTGDGEQKVLQLTWNGHESLWEKVKFLKQKQFIAPYDFKKNYLMLCSRSGLRNKTRFQYELMPGFEKSLEGEITDLIDLEKVYLDRKPEELQKVLENERVSQDMEDPNDRDFTANNPESKVSITEEQQGPQPSQQSAPVNTGAAPHTQPAAQPSEHVQTTETAQPTQPQASEQTLTEDQALDVEAMMQALEE